ncbi:GFA family protein [Gemmobacter serpentinus]|uniref:GFA family protein n=1 Tax=Gemmobacter serpentinus TaxID=2652247 RepID=UPI001CF660A3|nr:GFA family protein [Gemmobacter serpentinus]
MNAEMITGRSGQCLCGGVRIHAASLPAHMHACHCSMCRRNSGSAGMTVVVAHADLRIEGAEHITTYPSSDWAARSFCARCGAGLWYRLTVPDAETADYFLSVGILDDLTGLSLNQEIYIDQKPAGYAFAGDHDRLTGDEFEALLQASPEGVSHDDL